MNMSRGMDTVLTGTEVYGSDGEKLGLVNEVGSDHLTVERGLLSTKMLRIPYSAVVGVDGDGVHLSISKSQAKTIGTDQPTQ